MGKLINNKLLIKSAIFLLVLIPIFVFVGHTDFNAVRKELSHIGPGFVYIMLTSCLAYLIGTYAWYICLGCNKKQISLYQLFVIRQVTETVGVFNPTGVIGGDLLKINLLKSYHIDQQPAQESVVASRITAILSQLLLLISAMIWLLCSLEITSQLRNILYIVVSLLILVKIILISWIFSQQQNTRPTQNKSSFWQSIVSRVCVLRYDIKYFAQQHRKQFWQSYVLSTVHWIVGSTEFVMILGLLDQQVGLMHGLLLDMSIILVKSIGTFIPGQLGVEELGNKMLLAVIGINSASTWIAVSIIRRTRQLCWIGLGFILYLLLKKQTRIVL